MPVLANDKFITGFTNFATIGSELLPSTPITGRELTIPQP